MEVIILFWVLFAIISASIAYSKNRNWLGWGLVGLVLGLIGVIWVGCLPSLDD